MFIGFYTTDKALQYMAKATEGKTLVFTRGQYGNGELAEDTVILSLSALIAPLAELPISKKRSSENTMTITTQFSNKVNGRLLEPFHLMEAGLFGKVLNADGTEDETAPETLLLYANAQTKEKADHIPGVLTEFLINWPLTISGSANVTVEINESLIYPTMEDLNKRAPVVAESEGTGNNIKVTAEQQLADGQQVMVTLKEDLSAGSKLTYNDGEAYPIYNANGTELVDRQQVAGSTLHVVYSEANKCWYIVGGGAVEVATIVTTAGDGAAYTATISGITALEVGLQLVIIPHTNSTSKTATLNLNGLGEKQIRQRLSTNTSLTVAAANDNWLVSGKPITVTYNGTYWVAELTRPDANSIYGTVKIENGGTGASTAKLACENLGIGEVVHVARVEIGFSDYTVVYASIGMAKLSPAKAIITINYYIESNTGASDRYAFIEKSKVMAALGLSELSFNPCLTSLVYQPCIGVSNGVMNEVSAYASADFRGKTGLLVDGEGDSFGIVRIYTDEGSFGAWGLNTDMYKAGTYGTITINGATIG